MKLLLINPYFGQGESAETEGAVHSPPLGLGFIGTYVRDHTDCEVEIIDPIPQGLSEEAVLDKVRKADIAGLTCYTDTRFYCFDFAEKIKETNPACKLIIGGPHVYSLDRLILKHYPFIDALVRGEGEETMVELINAKAYKDIRGITWKDSGGDIIRNPDRGFIKDIDSLYVDYALLPDMSLYKPDIEAPIDLRRLKTAYMIESRGCPFQCTYCANEHWERTWRAVSPGKIVERMEHLVKTYDIEYFRFYDDLFTANKKRVLEFCYALKEKKLNIKFRILVRVNTSKEVLEALKEAGCESVGFGIESGSDKILKRIQKGITRQQIIDTIKVCKDLHLWVVGSFIVSLPDETKEEFKETLELTTLPDTFQTNILHLFPATTIYGELKARKEIDDEVWFDRNRYGGLVFYCKDNFPSANFSLDEAKWLALYTRYYQFIHKPSKVIKQHGILLGLAIVLMAIADIPLKGRLFNFAYRYRNIYRKFTMRG